VSILCTRPDGLADPLVAALASAGHRVHAVPTVALAPVEPGSPLDHAAARLGSYDWIVVTSAAGARAIVEAARRHGALQGTDPDLAASPPRWAAVGEATAAVLEAAGVSVSVVPDVSRGDAITAALLAAGPLAARRVVLPRSDHADEALPRALRGAGAAVDEVIAYRTVEGPSANAGALRDALADAGLQAIVLCSGSAVRGLLALSAGADSTKPHPRVAATALVSIGPSTSAVIRGSGLEVAVEAAHPSVEGLLSAVRQLVQVPQEVAT